MRRWNGWGDDAHEYSLGEPALALLGERLGPGTPPRDARLEEVLGAVPPSRLPTHPLVVHDARERALHARGQSLPDWIALRSGRIGAFPDGVAFPEGEEAVSRLVAWARGTGTRLIPYGGGTSVVGHVNVVTDAPTLTVDMRRMWRLLRLDPESRLAAFGAGVTGPDLEAQLRTHGLTLGHYPQSFELSTLGGWIAARSSGQQSLGYGRIERLFAGGRVLGPAGTLELPPLPASAAGPDLRELVLGSEGRLGILTQATVRVSELPQSERFQAAFLPDWPAGAAAVREVVQARIPLSMVRLSNAAETETLTALGGGPGARLLRGYLGLRGLGKGRCLLLLAASGRVECVERALLAAFAVVERRGGVRVPGLGARWRQSRFRAPYLRNTLWERGYAVDTLETAAPWSATLALVEAVEAALRGGLAAEGERVHAFTHLSHAYPDGASAYTTYLYRVAPDPERTLERFQKLKAAASDAIVAYGGTISHQHGVGVDHKPYLPAEKGALGIQALTDVLRRFDPDGLMNPGKLV